MVSLKIHVISTFLMVFITIDKTYTLTCGEIMQLYYPVLNNVPFEYYNHIFKNVVYNHLFHYEARAYMNFIYPGIYSFEESTESMEEFCKNPDRDLFIEGVSESENVSDSDTWEESDSVSACEDELEQCGFTNVIRDNVRHAYYNLSISTLEEQTSAIQYLNYLFGKIQFNNHRVHGGRTPWEYCHTIEICVDLISTNLPEVTNFETVEEVFDHIYENINRDAIHEANTMRYVNFIFYYANRGVLDNTENPILFCRNSQNCIRELESVGFNKIYTYWNLEYAYYKLTVTGLQGKEHANRYFNYLRSQILLTVNSFTAFIDGFSPTIFCHRKLLSD